ncbi:MAG: sulfatase-like hydrolase/transferase [Bryobacteraceae bacterium]
MLRGIAGLAAAPAILRAQRRKPNILIILADDLGYGDLSSWGSRDLRTPNVDALAASGVRFDRFYANSPVCSPTRAALLTGRYPDVAGVPGVIRTERANSWGYLSANAELLPKPLRGIGYHSAIVGKWHLGLEAPNLPNLRGFDHFSGFLGDMMDDYYHHRRRGRNYMRLNDSEIDPQGHATDVFTGWAVEYLQSRKGRDQPFLLYLAYNAPHAPVQPPQDWLERVKRREPGIGEKRAKLVALIEHMDAGVGRVMDALKANGHFENTLVVFVSDNGGDLGSGAACGPLRGGKGQMYEGGIRVPMCAAWPGRIAPKSKSGRVGLTMDLFTTVCEAAGARPPEGVDGVSLLADMVGEAQRPPKRDLVWVRREGNMMYAGREFYALRRGDWKLLQNTAFQAYELYNLADDPEEKHDLAKAEPKVYRELVAALMLHVQRAGRTPWQRPS